MTSSIMKNNRDVCSYQTSGTYEIKKDGLKIRANNYHALCTSGKMTSHAFNSAVEIDLKISVSGNLLTFTSKASEEAEENDQKSSCPVGDKAIATFVKQQ